MKSTIERAIEKLENPVFDFKIDPDKFFNASKDDRELIIDSLSEKEKWENINMFKTLENGKVGWKN